MTNAAHQLTTNAAVLPPALTEDVAAETALLGRLLSRGEGYPRAARLSVSDFSQRKHQLVWHAMQKVIEEGGTINFSSVEGKLITSTLDKGPDKGRHPIDIVSAEYLSSLLLQRVGDVEALTKRVAEMALIRKGLRAIDEMRKTLLDTKPTVDVRADHMLTLVTQYGLQVQALSGRHNTTLSEALDDHAALVRQRQEAHSSGDLTAFGVTSLFQGLQRLLNGYKRGKLYLIGARPGRGKSALALNEALSAMKQGSKVVFITLEMEIVELMDRLMSIESSVGNEDIEMGNISPADVRRLQEAHERLAGYEAAKRFTYLDFPPQPKMTEIERRLNEHMALVGADIVFIDQISDEMISPEHPRDTAVEKISKASAKLKAWAKTFNVPIVALCQLNRDAAKATDGIPTLETFASSSSLEKTADATIALYLPEGTDTAWDVYAVNAIVLKHRGGRVGTAHLKFTAKCTKFEDAQ